jgi:hypothetical protein
MRDVQLYSGVSTQVPECGCSQIVINAPVSVKAVKGLMP